MEFKLNKNNLNFRIYTSPSVPSFGNANDIVIISDVPMKNWLMSPNDPNGSPRNVGDVWITYSVSGNTFNLLNTNSLNVSTISAYQYLSTGWTRMEAKTYQNGAWVDWFPEGALYCNGAFAVPVKDVGYDTRYPGTHSLGDGYFLLEMGTAGYTTMLFTDEKIKLDDFSTMTVEYNSATPLNEKTEVMLIVNDEQNADTPVASIQRKGVASATLTLDISTISGSYYLAISIYNTGRQEVKITDWRLNK